MPNPASSRRHTANPVKDTGATKARTRQIVDREPPRGAKRKPASQTVTGHGGRTRGGRITIFTTPANSAA